MAGEPLNLQWLRAEEDRMLRRLVALLLLPFVLLAQSAALGHAHGGREPRGHGLRPHVHTSFAPERRAHDHHHHHGPAGHHHDGDDEAGPGPHTVPEPEAPSDHDSDAFYLEKVDAVVSKRIVADDGSSPASLLLALPGPCEFVPARASTQPRSAHWNRPPPTDCSCPLYVRHLTLLI